MLINNLELSHFRNYDHFFIEFDKGINILIGGNAQGKTNIIEAIYLLSVCRSFRTHINDQMIQFDYNFAKVKGNIYSNQRNHQAELVAALCACQHPKRVSPESGRNHEHQRSVTKTVQPGYGSNQ